MILSDGHIRDLCVRRACPKTNKAGFYTNEIEGHYFCGERWPSALEHPMVEPFSEPVSGNGIISYGLTSAGYDLRLGPDFLHFPEGCGKHCTVCPGKGECGKVADPKAFKDEAYRDSFFRKETVNEGAVWISPHQYVLGRSLEYLRIPKFLKARCVGKSTLARTGILINTTPLEPEWCGYLTIEIGNITDCPAKIYVGEGIAQLEFETLTMVPQQTYASKGGKYQNQLGVVPAVVK